MEGALTAQDAAREGEYGVRQRNGKRQHRQHEGDDGIELEHSDDGDRRHDVAEHQCARIAHEYLRRIEVIRNEAEAAAHERRENDRDVYVRVGNEQHGHGRDCRNAVGKSVKTVDEVNGVCDADYPQYGDGHGEDADGDRLLARYEQGV